MENKKYSARFTGKQRQVFTGFLIASIIASILSNVFSAIVLIIMALACLILVIKSASGSNWKQKAAIVLSILLFECVIFYIHIAVKYRVSWRVLITILAYIALISITRAMLNPYSDDAHKDWKKVLMRIAVATLVTLGYCVVGYLIAIKQNDIANTLKLSNDNKVNSDMMSNFFHDRGRRIQQSNLLTIENVVFSIIIIAVITVLITALTKKPRRDDKNDEMVNTIDSTNCTFHSDGNKKNN